MYTNTYIHMYIYVTNIHKSKLVNWVSESQKFGATCTTYLLSICYLCYYNKNSVD